MNSISPIGGKIINIKIQAKVFSGLFLPNRTITKIIKIFIINEIEKIAFSARI